MKLNKIMLGLEDENRDNFSNFLKETLGDDYNLKGQARYDALESNYNYGDMLFYIGARHDLDALKKVRDEVGLPHPTFGLGGLIEVILDDCDPAENRDVKNEMISILADCGWDIRKHSELCLGDNDNYLDYLFLSGVTKENANKILRQLNEQ